MEKQGGIRSGKITGATVADRKKRDCRIKSAASRDRHAPYRNNAEAFPLCTNLQLNYRKITS